MDSVRAATREDGARCAELWRRALEDLQRNRGGALFVRRELGALTTALLRPGGLDRLLVDPRRRVLVGTVDGETTALAAGRVEDVGDVTIGVVEALYVEPQSRAVGVGGALLGALTSWFETLGCRGVDAPALPGDRATKSLFESAGFKARLLTMHRSRA